MALLITSSSYCIYQPRVPQHKQWHQHILSTLTTITVLPITKLPRTPAIPSHRAALPKLRPNTRLIPRKVRATRTIRRRAPNIRLTLPRVTVPSTTEIIPTPTKPIDTTTLPKRRPTRRPAILGPARPVRRPRPIIPTTNTILLPAPAEPPRRTTLPKPTPLALHPARTRPVLRHCLLRHGRNAHGIIEPQVPTVRFQKRVVLPQLRQVEPEALGYGPAVVAGDYEVVASAVWGGAALGGVGGGCARVVGGGGAVGVGRRDGAVGFVVGAAGGAGGPWLVLSATQGGVGVGLPFTHALASRDAGAAALDVGVPAEELVGGDLVCLVGVPLGKLVTVGV